MPGSPSMRLVESALRCYPRRWRSRHGDEAAEIASLLIRNGAPAHTIAWSYLMGAARTRLVIEPRRRLGAAVGALLLAIGSLGVPLALLSSSAPGQRGERDPLTHRPAAPRRSAVRRPTGRRSAVWPGARRTGPL
jgi:hypothetical protein